MSRSAFQLLGCLEASFCLIAILAVFYRRQWNNYWSLVCFLSVRATATLAELIFLYEAGRGLERHFAYQIYFYVYWCSFAVESLLGLTLIYQVFRLAMAPLKGLQHLGTIIFRWAAVISVVLAIGSAFTPQNVTRIDVLRAVLSQLQRSQSILTLGLLLFVCFAIRPMGLSSNSRIFGVSLGLSVMATINLVQASWIPAKTQMFVSYDTIDGMAACLSLLIWALYFAVPEPRRRMIVLPTTSPFHRWNQIAMALGDEPGFVAMGGVPHELLAPAELEMMRRSSLTMVKVLPITANG